MTYHRPHGSLAAGHADAPATGGSGAVRRKGLRGDDRGRDRPAGRGTERTFYRYFADKREVLFDGQELLRAAILAGVANAPAAGSPMDLAAAALESAAEFFPDERRGWSRARQAIIESDPALQERELLKLASLAADLGRALQDRGIPQPGPASPRTRRSRCSGSPSAAGSRPTSCGRWQRSSATSSPPCRGWRSSPGPECVLVRRVRGTTSPSPGLGQNEGHAATRDAAGRADAGQVRAADPRPASTRSSRSGTASAPSCSATATRWRSVRATRSR